MAAFSTLEDALSVGSRSLKGEGAALLAGVENASLMGKLRQAALRADPIIDAAAIHSATDASDDAAQKAKRRLTGEVVAPGPVNALFNKVRTGSERERQQNKPIPKAPEHESPLDKGVQLAETGLQYAVYVPLATDLALPAVGWVANKMGMTGAHKALNAPKHFLEKTKVFGGVSARAFINDGIQVGFNAIQSYGVAKGFAQNLAALKEMISDITGKEPRHISTMAVLTGDVPPLLSDIRSHFDKEYGARGLIQVAGWGLVLRDLFKGKPTAKTAEEAKQIEEHLLGGKIGLVSGILPGLVGMGVDMLMGTSATEIYSGFKKAFEAGQPIAGNEYAAFILAINPDGLAKRKVGKQVALELGTEFASQKASPKEMLKQMSDGRFKAKIDGLIAKDEALMAEKQALKAKAVADNKVVPAEIAAKTSGAKPSRPEYGKFTAKYNKEQSAVAEPHMTQAL